MFTNYLLEALLESKIEDVLNNSKYDTIPSAIKQHYLEQIPDKNSNHLRYILDQHLKGTISPHNDIHSTLNDFNRVKEKLPKKRVEQYKNYMELEHAILPHKDNLIDKDTHIDYEDNDVKVTKHDSNASMIKAAKLDRNNPFHKKCNGKATWCTAADSEEGKLRYDRYTDEGKTSHYVILNKHNNRKTAFVPKGNDGHDDYELRDENDTNIGERPENYHKFLLDNKGVEHSSAGKTILSTVPHVKHMFDEIHHNSSEDDLNMAMYNGKHAKLAALNHPKASYEHVIKPSLNDADPEIRLAAIDSKNVKDEDLTNALHDDNHEVKMKAASKIKNPHALEAMAKHWGMTVLFGLLGNHHLTNDHINDMFHNENMKEAHRLMIADMPNIDERNINNVLNTSKSTITQEHVLKNKNVTVNNLHTALDGEGISYEAKRHALQNPLADESIIQKGLLYPDYKINFAAIDNKKATAKNIDTALDNSNENIRMMALNSHNVTHANLEKALSSKDYFTRFYAVNHKETTKEMLKKASLDDSEMVSRAAIEKLSRSK